MGGTSKIITLKWLLPPLILILILLGVGYALGTALTPLLLSYFAAYFVFPFIKQLEKKGVHRTVATGVVMGGLGVMLIIASATLFPKLYKETINFAQALPSRAHGFAERVDKVLADRGFEFELRETEIIEWMRTEGRESLVAPLKAASKSVFSFINHSLKSVIGILLSVLNLLLIPLFFFYIIDHYEETSSLIQKLIPLPEK